MIGWRAMEPVWRHAVAALVAALPAWSWAAEQHALADVPYVPTPPGVVDAMLRIAGVGPHDFVIDLGSGDGRIVIAAAQKHGARGFGVEIDGALVSAARREAQRAGVRDRVEFREGNLFATDIGVASVVTMYLYPGLMMQLRPRLFAELKPGTRVVAHDFDMDAWRPDARVTVPVPDKPYGPPSSEVFLWIMPANAAGACPPGDCAHAERLMAPRAARRIRFMKVLQGRRCRTGVCPDCGTGTLSGQCPWSR